MKSKKPTRTTRKSEKERALARERAKENLKSVYSRVSSEFIEAVKSGNSIYHRPWEFRVPASFSSGKAYRGVNSFSLSQTSMINQFESSQWIFSPRSGKGLDNLIEEKYGFKIKPGETPSRAVFFSPFPIADSKKKTETNDEVKENNVSFQEKVDLPDKDEKTTKKQRKVLFSPRFFNGYNLSQLDGVAESDIRPQVKDKAPVAFSILQIALSLGATIAEGYDFPEIEIIGKSNYKIGMPNRSSFSSEYEFYRETLNSLSKIWFLEKEKESGFSVDSPGEGSMIERGSRENVVVSFGASLASLMMLSFLDADIPKSMSRDMTENEVANLAEWTHMMESDSNLFPNSCAKAQACVLGFVDKVPSLAHIYGSLEEKELTKENGSPDVAVEEVVAEPSLGAIRGR